MIPTPDQVTPQWLTATLKRRGIIDTDITDIQRTQIGTGQIGKCVRFDLTYATTRSDCPTSIVGKFPSDDPISRATGVEIRNYYREICFYNQIAERLSISLPVCYHADIEGEGPEFILLLEDMAPAEQGNQLEGCSPEVAQAAVLELVGLQAPTWCDASLKHHDWLYTPPETVELPRNSLYAQCLPGFIDRYGEHLAADQIAILSQVADSPDCPLFTPPGDIFCLEHVDYRLDNMLINTTQPNLRVTVVDWQSVIVGKPLNDVGYFLGAGLLPDVRRGCEEQIVRDYHNALLNAGITDFDWPECWEQYRQATFAGFGVTVVASMIVGRTERGDQMFITMADRHSRHALDHNAQDFLS